MIGRRATPRSAGLPPWLMSVGTSSLTLSAQLESTLRNSRSIRVAERSEPRVNSTTWGVGELARSLHRKGARRKKPMKADRMRPQGKTMKLKIARETLRQLDAGELGAVMGGGTARTSPTGNACPGYSNWETCHCSKDCDTEECPRW